MKIHSEKSFYNKKLNVFPLIGWFISQKKRKKPQHKNIFKHWFTTCRQSALCLCLGPFEMHRFEKEWKEKTAMSMNCWKRKTWLGSQYCRKKKCFNKMNAWRERTKMHEESKRKNYNILMISKSRWREHLLFVPFSKQWINKANEWMRKRKRKKNVVNKKERKNWLFVHAP